MKLTYINILKICAYVIGIIYAVACLIGIIFGLIALGYIKFKEFGDKELLSFIVHLIILPVSVILMVGVKEEKQKLLLPWIIAIVLKIVLDLFSIRISNLAYSVPSLTCICLLHKKLSKESQNSQSDKINNEEEPVTV